MSPWAGGTRQRRAVLVLFALVATAIVTVGTSPSGPPVASALDQKVAVDLGSVYGGACAITDDGAQWCWGSEWDGNLANGSGGYTSYEDDPALQPVRSNGSSLATTSGVCHVTSTGSVRCWGNDGIIEDGSGSLFSDPPWGANVPTSYGFGAAEDVAGRCALLTSGAVQCQGWNSFGQLGDGSPSWPSSGFAVPPPSAPTAVTVSSIDDAVDLTAGSGAMCVARSTGGVSCWGMNRDGELGDPSFGQTEWPCDRPGGCRDARHSLTPVDVPGIEDAVGVEQSCALRAEGKVSCWGRNSGGRFVPAGSTSDVLGPTEIAAFDGAVDLAVSGSATCAVMADGEVRCQGSGSLGDGATSGVRSITVAAFNDDDGTLAAEVESNGYGFCVRTRVGQIACWGGPEYASGIGVAGYQTVNTPTFVLGFGGGLPAPELAGEIRFEHLDPENDSPTFESGENFHIVLRVEASDGDGPVTVDVPGATELFDGIDQLEVVEEPIPAEGESVEMEPGTFREYTWLVKGAEGGHFTVEARIEGRDELDNALTPLDLSEESKILALRITIEATPNDVNVETDELPLPVDVTVTVENVSADPVDNVRLQGWLDWSPLDPDEILPDVGLEFVDPEAVETEFGTGQMKNLGSIDPGPTNAVTQTYALQATGRAHAQLEQLVTYVQEGEQVNALATSDLKIGGLLLEFSSRVTKPIITPDVVQTLPAGEAIRVEGTIKNIADFPIEVGPPAPTVTGNAGAMSVVWDPTGAGPAPQDTATVGTRWLQPDEEVTFLVRITTQWSDPRTYGAEPSGGTRATVEFTPWGRYPDPDSTTEPPEDVYFETERMVTDDDELNHVVSIDDSIEIPEFDALDFTAGVFVGSIEGLGHAAVGVVTGVIETPYAIYNTMRGVYEFIEKVWGSFSPEELETFEESVLYATYQFMMRSAEIAKQTYDEVRPQLDAVLTAAFTEISHQWELGDYVGATRTYARYTSELIGSILIPVALAKLAKAPQAVAAAQRAQAVIQSAAVPTLQAIRGTRVVRSLYTNLLKLRSGLILGADDIKRLYGIAADELAEFQKIADRLDYLITVRSRHVSSIDWIRDLRAMVKPEALKIKSVNELDIRLGYDTALIEGRSPLGALVFKKPQPLIRWDAGGEAGEIGRYVREFVQSKGFQPGTHEYEAALDRTYQRMKEWRKFEAKYKKFDQEGIEVTYNYEGNRVPPDVRTAETKYLGFDLQEVPGEPDTYIVRLMDEQGEFRPVTGDIDAIAFTKADGSPLNAKEHADLLDEISANPLLQGQHGETATFDPPGSGLGGLDIIASQFKPGEPALQIMPGSAGARVVRFNPDKSRWASARDFNLHWDGGYVEISRRLATGAVRPFQVTVPASIAADATEAFVINASLDGDPNLGRCRVVESDAHPDAVSLFGDDGGLFELVTDGAVEPSPLQDQCFSEGDPIDIVIRSATTLSSFLGLRPQAPVSDGVPVAARGTTLPLTDPTGFDVGDVVAVGAGTTAVETRTIVSVDPVVVDPPLSRSYEAGTLVMVVDVGGQVGPSPSPVEASLYPLKPARLLDTRPGEVTIDGRFEGLGRLTAGSVTRVTIAGRGGVDADAAAVALNVTAVQPSGVGYVTLFPCGSDQPLTSSLNYAAGGATGNSAIVKLNDDGELCAFTFAETHLVIDVNGWLADTDGFESLVSARLAETRAGERTVDGVAEEIGRLAAGSVTEVQIAGRGGVDLDADAVALNVTAVGPSAIGYVTLYPCDEDRPTTSSLNYGPGGAVGNSAVVSLSASGSLCAFTFADTDLVIDVNAWFSADATFDAFVPARIFESRSGETTVDDQANGVGRLDADSVATVAVAGRGGVPDDAVAVALNVTAVGPSAVGYVTLFPCDGTRPLTSSLNYGPGSAVGNSAVVKLAADGTLCAYTFAETDLVIDVNAAWTPAAA